MYQSCVSTLSSGSCLLLCRKICNIYLILCVGPVILRQRCVTFTSYDTCFKYPVLVYLYYHDDGKFAFKGTGPG